MNVESPSSRYMGAPAELVEAPNGAIVNKEVLDRLPTIAWTKGPEIENPVEGVYVLGGYIISACIVVEAADGLIVFDTGDTKKDGERLLEAIRSVSEKPVEAVVYGHSHYVFGAGVIAEGNEDVVVYGHPNLNDVVTTNLASGGAPAYFPEISPLLTARALQQFNFFLPEKGPDAWFNPTNLSVGEVAFLPVNRPVADGEVIDVLGIKMQFFVEHGTDDKVHTTVWLPEREIAIENALWGRTGETAARPRARGFDRLRASPDRRAKTRSGTASTPTSTASRSPWTKPCGTSWAGTARKSYVT
jgi:glyoxylase-like metal-dependent hydrolase (beta-lactamase superfamily II)